MTTCERCGETRDDADLAVFHNVRTGVTRYACRAGGRDHCLADTIARLGPAPAAGGEWRLQARPTTTEGRDRC